MPRGAAPTTDLQAALQAIVNRDIPKARRIIIPLPAPVALLVNSAIVGVKLASRLSASFRRRRIEKDIEKRINTIRWSQISMIFQSAMNAFNPVYRVGDQIEEALEAHMEMTGEQRKARIQELFKLV